MKRFFLILLVLCLVLCGCAAQPEPTIPTTLPPETEPPVPQGFYAPGSEIENKTGGAVRAYPLGNLEAYDILPLGDNLLLFSYAGDNTHLTLLTGDTLYLIAQQDIPQYISPWMDDLQSWDNSLSYFDSAANCTVVLDSDLDEVSRIPAPEGLVGTPLLSHDRNTLYYCTQDSIRALELETGVSRILKETYYAAQTTVSLLLEDTVLECRLTDQEYASENIFLSTRTGETLYMTQDYLPVSSHGQRWYAGYSDGPVYHCLFGQGDGEARELATNAVYPDCTFLPQAHAALLMDYNDHRQVFLDYYDLESGLHTASLTLDSTYCPWSFQIYGQDRVAFLNYDDNGETVTLYLWDTDALPTGDTACYTGPHYNWANPDLQALEACAQYADQLEEIHGINLLVYEEALEVQPWDYTFTAEYQPRLLNQELERLDKRLSNYPQGFLAALASRYDSLSIGLVRGIYGTPESGSLESANGLQFWVEQDAYLTIATGQDTEYTLYHEICHLIDNVVLNETNAYDQWDLLNPPDFQYDYDYIANQSRTGEEYLGDQRYFIDTYAMSFPKEDRARLMEYAMTEYNEFYFEGDYMQAKLRTLCQGIRMAFGLEDSPETFLWEQYLKEPLAPTQ